jgi:polyhydroxyalkanoate synthesis regulator phasin
LKKSIDSRYLTLVIQGAGMSIASKVRLAAWQTSFLFTVTLVIAGAAVLLGSSKAIGYDASVINEKFADLEPAIADLRKDAGQDRRALVKANMLLTESEGGIFWPLYDEYRAERHKLGDRRVKVITDYLALRGTMSQDDAENMTKESLAIQEDTVSVKQKYVKKMSKVLSARTVARFFQIDQKLDAIAEMALAAQIPLTY